MRPLVLTAAVGDVLAFIRRTTFPLSVYGRSAARVEPMARDQVNLRINRFGVPVPQINMYKRYTAEMLKAFRTRTGEPLATALELSVRKWANLGLAPELLQQILCDCHQKFHAAATRYPNPERLRRRAGADASGPTNKRSARAAPRAVLLPQSKTSLPATPKA